MADGFTTLSANDTNDSVTRLTEQYYTHGVMESQSGVSVRWNASTETVHGAHLPLTTTDRKTVVLMCGGGLLASAFLVTLFYMWCRARDKQSLAANSLVHCDVRTREDLRFIKVSYLLKYL